MYGFCLLYLGQVAYNTTLKQLCFGKSGTLPVGVTGFSGDVYLTSGSNTPIWQGADPNSYCNNKYPGQVAGAAWAPANTDLITVWNMSLRNNFTHVGTTSGRTYTADEQYRANPTRWWRCDIRDTTGFTHTALSNPFTYQDVALAPLICPTVPSNKTVNRISIYEITGTLTGTTQRLIYQEDLTTAYTNWRTVYPECTNGSCFLDLRQGGNSCFYGGTTVCNGWFGETNRDSTYSCHYGTHTLPLSECYVYANTFDPELIISGEAYGDPSTGATTGTQTSPTLEDEIVASLLKRPWLATYGFDLAYDKAEKAKLVARTCVAMSAMPGQSDLGEKCKTMPIFAPGIDIREAAKHDREAITGAPATGLDPAVIGNPAWVQLDFLTSDEKKVSLINPVPNRQWYSGVPPCYTPTLPRSCDEYPYYGSVQGGPGSSLRMIPFSDNSLEGTRLSGFVSICGLPSKPIYGEKRQYLVIPVDLAEIPTVGICASE